MSITHEEALRLIDEQLGERVHISIFVPRAGSESGQEGSTPFVYKSGRLGNPLVGRPPRLEPDVGYYGFGREAADAFPFPPLAGTIQLRDSGIDFLLPGGSSIRVAWRGSAEIGDGPDAGRLARMKLLGLMSEDKSATDELSLDMKRFLAEARRAKAAILSASPTDFSFKDKAGEGRRIWELAVRVIPDDEPAFEATAEVAWRLIDEVEEMIERGDFLSAKPAEAEELEVAFDPGNREWVMALSAGEDHDGSPFRFKGMIVGRPLGPSDEDASPPSR